MTKKLLVVFASGVVLALALLSLAWVIGGDRFLNDVQHKNGWNIVFDDDDDSDHGPKFSKTVAYDGTQPLTLDAPVSLKFVRGDAKKVTIEGRRDIVDAVRWDNGRLYFASGWSGHHRLQVTVVAPQVPAVYLKGTGDIELNGLSQPALAVDLTGAGNIDANGKVDTVTITGRGAGNVDFSAVEAKDATVRASGAGNVEIAATGKVDVALSGVGNITLHKKPAQLTSSVSGVGSIDHDY